MRFLVFADSHRCVGAMEDIIARIPDITSVLFLGDNYEDMLAARRRFPDRSFTGVAGNCDYGANAEAFVNADGQTLWLTHGHRYHVKQDYLRLSLVAREREADICLFGHTHSPELFWRDGILFMNPGSISLPRGRFAASYGVLEMGGGVPRGSVVEITRNGARPVLSV